MTTSSLTIAVGDENNAYALKQVTVTTSSFTLTGSLIVSGTVNFPSLIDSNTATKVVLLDNNGQLFTTASSAIGGGGSGTPGGSNKQIQFNANNAFSGSSNFTFDSSSNNLILTGSLIVSGGIGLNVDIPSASLHISGTTIINGSNLTTQPFSSFTEVPTQIAGNTGIRGNLYVYPKSGTTSSVVFGGGGYSSWTLRSLSYDYFQIRSTPNEGGTPGPPTTLMHFSSGSNDEFRIGVLNETPEYNFDISGSARITNSLTITGSLLVTQSYISTVDYIDYRVLTTSEQPAHAEGRTHWLDDTKTLQIDTDVNNFSIEIGHQNVVRARNVTGFDLAAGKVVYINGESGNRPTITTASWDGDPSSAATLGFVAQQINDNQTGYVVTNGMLRGIDTNAFNPGTQLYLSSSGDFTSTIPVSPKHEVRLGKTITQATDGVIYVDVMNGYELGELHDVLINSSTNGDLVVKSGSLWINSKQLTGSYGLTGSLNTLGSITGSFTGSLTGSLFGTASWAGSASQALTASFWSGYLSTSSFIGNGLSSSFNINHGFNTRNLHITVYESASTGETVYPDIRRINANTASIIFANPPSTNQYIVYISQ